MTRLPLCVFLVLATLSTACAGSGSATDPGLTPDLPDAGPTAADTGLDPAPTADAPDGTGALDALPDAPPDTLPDALADATQDAPQDLPAEVAPDAPAPVDAAADLPPEAGDAPDAPSPSDLPAEAETTAPSVDVEAMMAAWPLGAVTRTTTGAFRGTFESPSGTLGFLVLTGTHFQMGWQHGNLTAEDLAAFWDDFLASFSDDLSELAGDIGMTPDQLVPLLQSVIQMVWDHMVPFMSPEFLDEVAGFAAGAAAAGVSLDGWDMDLAVKALLVLSNISDLNWSGSFEDALDKLSTGLSPALTDWYATRLLAGAGRALGRASDPARLPMTFANSCSFFGTWGAHTKDGHYLGSRNLDWGTDTGIRKLAGLVFYFPDGGIPHVAIGYLGFIGSLAGMNERGVVLSEVGSESELERLKGEPWGFKFRRILEHADSLDDALDMALGLEAEGPHRPTTIGYNFAIGYGDPDGGGAGACGAVLETNGLRAGVYRHAPDCSVDARSYDYAEDGSVALVTTNAEDPALANLEADAVEIDAQGAPRLFRVDETGAFVLSNGLPIEDPAGKPYPVGLVIPCAFYRGDEALMHGNRMWQRASNGPQGGTSLLVASGSYKNRYKLSRDAFLAIREGQAYAGFVPSSDGVARQIGLTEGEWIARGAAMGSNVMSIVYDATALAIRLSFEQGTGPTWENAVAHGYVHVDLKAIFDLAKGP